MEMIVTTRFAEIVLESEVMKAGANEKLLIGGMYDIDTSLTEGYIKVENIVTDACWKRLHIKRCKIWYRYEGTGNPNPPSFLLFWSAVKDLNLLKNVPIVPATPFSTRDFFGVIEVKKDNWQNAIDVMYWQEIPIEIVVPISIAEDFTLFARVTEEGTFAVDDTMSIFFVAEKI